VSSPEEDADIAACTPDINVKAAAGGLAVSGILLVLLCAQTASLLPLNLETTPIIGGMGVAGALSIFAATRVARLYTAGAWLGVIVGGVASLSGLAWLLFSVIGGLFSLLALAAPPIALLSTLATVLVLPRAQRAEAARERLRAAGLDLGR
jgi:hypothetical protein